MSPFYYVADGCMYRFADGESRELRSEVRDSYLGEVRRTAEQNEWRYNGEGAAFTGAYRPGMSVEERVREASARILCVGEYVRGADTNDTSGVEGDTDVQLIYSMDMGTSGGLYLRNNEGGKDGIVLCRAHTGYGEFDILGDYMTYAEMSLGESHIGIINIANKSSQICTEGHVIESSPVFCPTDRRKIYFSSAGLPRDEETAAAEADGPPPSYSEQVSRMYDAASYGTERGPSALCALDLSCGTVEEVLADERYDHLHPAFAADGTLYYIRRPYEAARASTLGCMADALLLPVRLVGALFGFLNVFSAKYAGKTLSRSDVKRRDERTLRIDGNLIHAERELKQNRRRGDEHPGIVPRSWELRRLCADGTDVCVKRGVCAFAPMADGTLLVSNGSSVLALSPDGRETCLLRAEGVTFLRAARA